MPSKETFPFERPFLINRVQRGLPVVCDRFAISIDEYGRVEMRWAGSRISRGVELFRISDEDVRVVFQSNGPGPKRADTRARGL